MENASCGTQSKVLPNQVSKRSLHTFENIDLDELYAKLHKQEPSGHLTSSSNKAWVIVNCSSTRVSWAHLAFYDCEGVDSPSSSLGNNVT